MASHFDPGSTRPRPHPTPVERPRARRLAMLAGVLLLCAAANLLTAWAALQTPWLGLSLAPADTADGLVARPDPSGPARILGRQVRLLDLSTYTTSNAIRLMPPDLVADPDRFGTYAEVDAFLSRQDHLRALLEVPVMMNWRDADGTIRQAIATPGWRPMSSLPASFWIRQAIASLVFVACAVPFLRGSKRRSGLMLAAGAAVMLAVCPASIYGARELALSAPVFRALWALNHAGATLFGCVLIAMLARGPRPLLKPRTLALVIAISVAWLLADLMRLIGNPDWGSRVPLMLQWALALALGIRQVPRRRGSLAP